MQRWPSLARLLLALPLGLLPAACLLTAPPDEELVGSCDDDTKNGGETDADCGGPCSPCGTGRTCALPADCASGVCTLDACEAASCTDGVKNATETDIDCGGPNLDCPLCAPGQRCETALDCDTSSCIDGVCVGPACDNGVLDGDESDVDCGFNCPTQCEPGQLCFDDDDCASALCDPNTFKCQ